MDTIEEQPLGKQATLICDVFLHKVKVQIKFQKKKNKHFHKHHDLVNQDF